MIMIIRLTVLGDSGTALIHGSVNGLRLCDFVATHTSNIAIGNSCLQVQIIFYSILFLFSSMRSFDAGALSGTRRSRVSISLPPWSSSCTSWRTYSF